MGVGPEATASSRSGRHSDFMSTIQEIEDAIRRLPEDDLAALRAWFAEFDAAAWDRQFERDVAEGRLDASGPRRRFLCNDRSTRRAGPLSFGVRRLRTPGPVARRSGRDGARSCRLLAGATRAPYADGLGPESRHRDGGSPLA